MPTKTKTDPIRDGRLRNLGKANVVRIAKSDLKRDLGVMDQVEALKLVADRLENDPGVLLSFSLEELLLAIPGVGRVKARQLSKAVERQLAARFGTAPLDPMPLSVRVRDLVEPRRVGWAAVLRERAHDLS